MRNIGKKHDESPEIKESRLWYNDIYPGNFLITSEKKESLSDFELFQK